MQPIKIAAFAAWAASSLACGAASELEAMDPEGDGVDLGTLERPIYMPTNYGIEGTTLARCVPPWTGGRCDVPDQKTVKWRIGTGCSPWTTTRINATMSQLAGFWGSDFAVTPTPDPAFSNVIINCNTTETLAQNPRLGRLQTSGGETHSSTHGTLWQFGTGVVTVYEGKIFALPSFQCIGQACEARRVNFMMNVVKHEVGGHWMGLGHDGSDGNGNDLMDASFSGTDTTKNVYTSALGYAVEELHGIDCYNEDSGSGDDCAD